MSGSELPQRKQPRLQDYDYSAPGVYFVTLCTQGKRCILSEIAVGAIHESPAVRLTAAGRCVQDAVEALSRQYDNLRVEKYVIMPNHVHLLIVISEERAIRESPLHSEGKRSLLDKAVGFLKMTSSKQIHVRYPELEVWQRSYHDHIIRGEADFREIWNYIDTNPARWCRDCFYPEGEA